MENDIITIIVAIAIGLSILAPLIVFSKQWHTKKWGEKLRNEETEK
ncbi:MAG: hypothetical protein ACRC6X_05775 [Culicoidibacterales bacterium]